MTKGTKVEFNDGRFNHLRKDGTFSRIYLNISDNKVRVHTVIIEDDKEIHKYVTVNIDEIHEI